MGCREVDVHTKAESPLPHWGNQWGGRLHRQKEGLPAGTAQSALAVFRELVIGGLTRAITVVLGS